MFSRVCVWATFRLGLELDQCKVYPITTKVFAGPNWYVLTSELLKLMHWRQSYVFTCPCHVEIHVACLGPLATSSKHLMMSQNRVYISKNVCLGDWNRGACLSLYLDRFNHSVWQIWPCRDKWSVGLPSLRLIRIFECGTSEYLLVVIAALLHLGIKWEKHQEKFAL